MKLFVPSVHQDLSVLSIHSGYFRCNHGSSLHPRIFRVASESIQRQSPPCRLGPT
jgi:hypothetical protein